MKEEPINMRLAHCLEDLIAEMAQCPQCREKMKGTTDPTERFNRRLNNAREALSDVKRATLDGGVL